MKHDNKPDKIGRRIKAMRQQRGLTLHELARRSGVPQSTLSLIEMGSRAGRNLTLETGVKLARTFGISLDVIAGVYDEKDERENEQLTAVAS